MVCFVFPLHEVTDDVFRFCFAPDVSRPLLGLEQSFFNEQCAGNGRVIENAQTPHCNWLEAVPVVAIFMKFDDLITQVYDREKGEEENREVAYATLEEKFEKPLEGYKFPPRAYVQFECVFYYPL